MDVIPEVNTEVVRIEIPRVANTYNKVMPLIRLPVRNCWPRSSKL